MVWSGEGRNAGEALAGGVAAGDEVVSQSAPNGAFYQRGLTGRPQPRQVIVGGILFLAGIGKNAHVEVDLPLFGKQVQSRGLDASAVAEDVQLYRWLRWFRAHRVSLLRFAHRALPPEAAISRRRSGLIFNIRRLARATAAGFLGFGLSCFGIRPPIGSIQQKTF
jgi:hypothetical protein